MDFLKRYKKMISLRGLTDHTMKSYCTYITAYLDFISIHCINILLRLNILISASFLMFSRLIVNCRTER